MSLKKTLGKLFLFGLLELGVLAGARITQEDIEKIMNAMHRTEVVQVQKNEDEK